MSVGVCAVACVRLGSDITSGLHDAPKTSLVGEASLDTPLARVVEGATLICTGNLATTSHLSKCCQVFIRRRLSRLDSATVAEQ